MRWKLFLGLDKQDLYNFEGLHAPVNNSIVEMDMLVLSLGKHLQAFLSRKALF